MILNVEGRTRETIMAHGFHRASTSIQDKKKDRPRWWHTGSGQAKQTLLKLMFQTPLNIISHGV